MQEKVNKYYVYLHTEGDEVVYVGKGCGCRAYRVSYGTSGSNTNQAHQAWKHEQLDAGLLPHDWVSFEAIHLTEGEALAIEAELIKELKPRFNRIHNPDHSFSSFWTDYRIAEAKRLRAVGLSYKDVAAALGTSTMTVYRGLNK